MQRSLGYMLNRKLAAALSSWLELVADRSSMARGGPHASPRAVEGVARVDRYD